MIETVNTLAKYEYVWIYGWNAAAEQFYCIPCDEKTNNGVAADPIAVNLSPSFSEKYNHLLVITKNVDAFRARLKFLNLGISKIDVIARKTGHLIMNPLTPEEIMNGDNVGTPVVIFCPKRIKLLYSIFKNNYYFFRIEAMGTYQNSVQCFFNYQRAYSTREFNSRGLFKIKDGATVEESIEYADEKALKPAYKILSFDIEAARLDRKFPRGDTILDRLCTVAFQTKTIFPYPTEKDEILTDVLVYAPDPMIKNKLATCRFDKANVYIFRTEKELLENVIRYIYASKAIYITGWNIIKFDYPFLMKRLLYHDMIPPYILENRIADMYSQRDVFDLAPPWLLSIDSMECRKKYFPRNLPVNPPSNSIDETARTCLDGISKDKIDIMKIHDAYKQMEENNLKKNWIFDYLKTLITYNIKDVELVTRLNEKLQVIQTLVPLSQMADLDPGDAIHYYATKIGVTFMKNFYQSAIFAPIDPNLYHKKSSGNAGLLPSFWNKYSDVDNDETTDKGKKGTYKGATVFEPDAGIHRSTGADCVLGCLDFASLYPSLMLTYNIARGYVTRVTKRTYLANRASYDARFVPLPQDDHVYLSLKNVTSPISFLCTELIRKRKIYKKTDPTIANALKIIVNSLYGICGLQGTMLYDPVVAALITAFGRHHLTKLKEYFEKRYLGLRVLYGDTDSVFIHYNNTSNEPVTLERMADEYNEKFLKGTGIRLEAEATFDCIIFVRKKLYFAKKTNGSGYKISGFPQRLNKVTHRKMNDALKTILDLTAVHSDDKVLVQKIRDFYSSMFRDITKSQDDGQDRENHILNIKVNPLKSYKSTSGKNYYVGHMYETYTGEKIVDTNSYVPVYDLIPIVKNLPGKRFSLCLVSEFDETIHTINKSASVTEFFSKTFDPILQVFSGLDNGNVTTLKDMSNRYISQLQSQSLFKYRSRGYYAAYDFSSGNQRRLNWLFIDFEHCWPSFYRNDFDKFINSNQAAVVRKPNVILNVELHSRDLLIRDVGASFENVSFAYGTLADDQSATKLISNKKFECLSQLGTEVKSILRRGKRFEKGKENHASKIKVRFINNVIKDDNDDDDDTDLKSILKLLCFIYNKKLTKFEIESLTKYEKTDEKKFLILLPFVAILRDEQNNVKYTFF